MEIPPRLATDGYLEDNHLRLIWSFDVDLGELIPGHHVVARGISAAQPVRTSMESDVERNDGTPRHQVHFEHVPGLSRGHVTPDWGFEATDDVGTSYNHDSQGAYDGLSGGIATHALREVGGNIPPEATRLRLRIEPGYDRTGHQWSPAEPWQRELTIDLGTRESHD
jgi:hypothetical protein